MTDLKNAPPPSAFAQLTSVLNQQGVLARHCAILAREPMVSPNPTEHIAAMERAAARAPDLLLIVNSAQVAHLRKLQWHGPKLFLAWGEDAMFGFDTNAAQAKHNYSGYLLKSNTLPKVVEVIRRWRGEAITVGLAADEEWWRSNPTTASEFAARCPRCTLFPVNIPLQDSEAITLPTFDHVDVWWVPHSRAAQDRRAALFAKLKTTQRPIIGSRTVMLQHGATITIQGDVSDWALVWARQIDAVLSGTSAASLPIERPRSYALGVSATTAFAVPKWLLLRADSIQR